MTVYLHLHARLKLSLYVLMLVLVFSMLISQLQGWLLVVAMVILLVSVIGFIIQLRNPNRFLSALKLCDDELSLYLKGEWQPFWRIRQSIVIRNWVYLKLYNEAGQFYYRLWLHRSDLKDATQWNQLCAEVMSRG